MTTAELIEVLKTYPAETEVFILDDGMEFPINRIGPTEDTAVRKGIVLDGMGPRYGDINW